MSDDTNERRARKGLFTLSVVGKPGEHKLQSVSGFRQAIDLIEGASESTRIDKFDLPSQLNMEALTLREAPFAGCGDQPEGNFFFSLYLNGTEVAHVRSVSGLGVNWAVSENRESTVLNVQKLFTKRTTPEITIKQVIELSEGDALFDEIAKMGTYQGPGRAFSVVGGATCAYRGDWKISLKKRDGSEVASWTIYQAFPNSYTPFDDLDATSDDVALRTLTLRSSPAFGTINIEERVSSWPGGGQIVSPDFLLWVSSAFNLPTRQTLVLNLYHPDALPGAGEPVKRWKLFNCWPSTVTYQDLDAGSPALCTREVGIAYDGYIPV